VAEAAKLEEWRRNRRKSLGALPGHAVFLLLVMLALWAARRWLHLPLWLAAAITALSALGLVGDALNILYLGRRIAAANREDA
jgi:hypothetical protein